MLSEFFAALGLERPLRKHAGGMFLGRGKVHWQMTHPYGLMASANRAPAKKVQHHLVLDFFAALGFERAIPVLWHAQCIRCGCRKRAIFVAEAFWWEKFTRVFAMIRRFNLLAKSFGMRYDNKKYTQEEML